LKLLKDIRIKTTSNTKPIILLTVLEAADIGLYQSLQQSLGVRAYLVKQKSTPNELIAAVNYSLSTS
jgi:CheY-like chemotaxis protein